MVSELVARAKMQNWRYPDGSIKTVRPPFYPASCNNCGWQGSSEKCGVDSGGDDSDVYCPVCHRPGADHGVAAEKAVLVNSRGREIEP
jgi:hypothetical protein